MMLRIFALTNKRNSKERRNKANERKNERKKIFANAQRTFHQMCVRTERNSPQRAIVYVCGTVFFVLQFVVPVED